MKKSTSFVLFVLIITITIFALYLWLSKSQVPELIISPNLTPDQQQRTVHLELGRIYEQHTMWEDARKEYQLAIGAQRDQITIVALNGIQRVLAHQDNIWLKLRSENRSFLTLAVGNILNLLVVFSVVVLVWRLVNLLPQRKRYLIVPFQSYESHWGEFLSRSIYTAIKSARQTHIGEAKVFSISENLDIPTIDVAEESTTLNTLLTAIDSFEIGTINFPLGRLILAMQRWINTPKYVIRGSVYCSQLHLNVEVEIQDTENQLVNNVLEISEDLSVEDDLAQKLLGVANILAYRILYSICPGLNASSWRSFRLLTEALKIIRSYQYEKTDSAILEDAVCKLEEATALDPGYSLALYNLGVLHNNLGRYHQAASMFQEVLEIDNYLRLEAIYNLGVAYSHFFQSWAYDQAIRQFTKIINEMQSNTSMEEEKRLLLALSHCGLAIVYARQVEYGDSQHDQVLVKEIEHNCEKAISLAGENGDVKATVYLVSGIAFLGQRHLEKAIEEFLSSFYLKPNSTVVCSYLGESYLEKTEYGKAAYWFKKAVEVSPRYEYAYYKLGQVYQAQGEETMAIDAYSKATHIADSHNDLGKLLVQEGDYDNALNAFRHAIELNSQLAEAFSNLAWYTIEAGCLDETSLKAAAKSARRAVQLNNGTKFEWHSRDVLGWILYNCGDLDNAENELRASIEVDDSRAQSRYHLALVYQKKGCIGEARQALIDLFSETSEQVVWRSKAEQLIKTLE